MFPTIFQQINETFDGVCVLIPNYQNINAAKPRSRTDAVLSSHCLRRYLEQRDVGLYIFFFCFVLLLLIYISLYSAVCLSIRLSGVTFVWRMAMLLCRADAFRNCAQRFHFSSLPLDFIGFHCFFCTRCDSKPCHRMMCVVFLRTFHAHLTLFPYLYWFIGQMALINRLLNVLDAFRFLSPYLRVGRLNDIIANRLSAIRVSMWNTSEWET